MTGTITTLDQPEPLTYDTEVPESIEVAKEHFTRLRSSGYLATTKIKGKPTHVREFEPEEGREYVMVPALRGG